MDREHAGFGQLDDAAFDGRQGDAALGFGGLCDAVQLAGAVTAGQIPLASKSDRGGRFRCGSRHDGRWPMRTA